MLEDTDTFDSDNLEKYRNIIFKKLTEKEQKLYGLNSSGPAPMAATIDAIKEDIERRYSLQLEDAQSRNNPNPPAPKSSAMRNLLPEIDEKEAVKEELSRIDSPIGNEKIVEPVVSKKTPSQPEKQKKAEPDFDLSEKNGLYASVYSLGDIIYRFFAGIIIFIFKLIKAPFIHIKIYFKKASATTKQGTKRGFEASVAEFKQFREETKSAFKAIFRAFRHPLSIPGVIAHYIKSTFMHHRKLLKSLVTKVCIIFQKQKQFDFFSLKNAKSFIFLK